MIERNIPKELTVPTNAETMPARSRLKDWAAKIGSNALGRHAYRHFREQRELNMRSTNPAVQNSVEADEGPGKPFKTGRAYREALAATTAEHAEADTRLANKSNADIALMREPQYANRLPKHATNENDREWYELARTAPLSTQESVTDYVRQTAQDTYDRDVRQGVRTIRNRTLAGLAVAGAVAGGILMHESDAASAPHSPEPTVVNTVPGAPNQGGPQTVNPETQLPGPTDIPGINTPKGPTHTI